MLQKFSNKNISITINEDTEVQGKMHWLICIGYAAHFCSVPKEHARQKKCPACHPMNTSNFQTNKQPRHGFPETIFSPQKLVKAELRTIFFPDIS